MLKMAGYAAGWVFLLVMGLLAGSAWAIEPAQSNCPVQLHDAQTQTLLVAQSRDQYEQRLAQAIRANQDLSRMNDAASAEIKKLREEVAKLKPALPEEMPK